MNSGEKIQENKDFWDALKPSVFIVLTTKMFYFQEMIQIENVSVLYKKSDSPQWICGEYILLIALIQHMNFLFHIKNQKLISNWICSIVITFLIRLCICLKFTKLQIKQPSYLNQSGISRRPLQPWRLHHFSAGTERVI